MALTSIEGVQTNTTIKTAKQITPFLDYRASHPDAVIEYRRSRIILHIYSDASYISETWARIIAGGYLLLVPKSNTSITAIHPENGPVHV